MGEFGMTLRLTATTLTLALGLACVDDGSSATQTNTSEDETGDGDSGDGDPGDGDGDSGDGDGDSGDGDGDGDSGDGDGDSGDGDPGDGDGDGTCELAALLDQALWDQLFLHKDDPACSGGNYTLQGLLDAAADYPSFACEGDEPTRRRELAAFLAQISHETTGGWPDAPDGPHTWGLCFIEEVGCEDNGCPQYCDPNNMQYPCAPGRTYHGRGALQLSWNYNYGQAGDALGVDILANPDMVKDDPKLAIQTALWFWMTEQLPKPSAHAVMVGTWVPLAQDLIVGRMPGFGMTTNIINGGLECSMPTTAAVEDRVGFFTRYADLLGTDVGDNLYCDMMSPYGG
jgi:basic endochitinase B